IYDTDDSYLLFLPCAFYSASKVRFVLVYQRTYLFLCLYYAPKNLSLMLSTSFFHCLFSMSLFCFLSAQLLNTHQMLFLHNNAIACNKPACCNQRSYIILQPLLIRLVFCMLQ